MAGGKRSEAGGAQHRRRRWLLTPLPQVAATVVAVVAVVATVLPQTDARVKGELLLVLIAIGTLGAIAMVEAYHRHAAGRGGASLMVVGALVVAASVAYPAFGPLPAEEVTQTADAAEPGVTATTSPPATGGPAAPTTASTPTTATTTAPEQPPLRAAFTEEEPPVWTIALPHDPGVPSERTGWQELLASGGVEVHSSSFAFTLANRSDEPLTIRDIRAVVVRSEPAPTAAEASVYTQGDSPLAEYLVELPAAEPGAIGELHRLYDDEAPPADLDEHEPFFADNRIELRPREIYEGSIVVRSRPETLLSYRFAISLSTPSRSFTVEEPELHRLSGLTDFDGLKYDHYYVEGYARWASQSICPSIRVTRWTDRTDDGCPRPAPGPETSPVPDDVFHTPGGRVSCRVGGERATCTVTAVATTFRVAAGRGRWYPGEEVPPSAGREVPWGSTVTVGDLACRVPASGEESGVVCINHATGHGFEASRVVERRRRF